MTTFALVLASVLVSLIFADRAVALALRWLMPLLPNDVAGPDGWLIDTRNGLGVFDRRA